jgi:hypothetical protein
MLWEADGRFCRQFSVSHRRMTGKRRTETEVSLV